jgi:hypothetical protein
VSEPTRYPLAWPAGRPRRPWQQRTRGQFGEKGEGDKTRRVSLATAVQRVRTEVERLDGIYPLISSNMELRRDGFPRGDRAAPGDPGVCVYFQLRGKPYAMACDRYDEVSQNVAAIAAHIEATRRIERYGVATAAETLQAFEALPAPFDAVRDWRKILGDCDTVTGVRDAWRAKAQEAHPDKGGHHAAMAELNAARDAALKELSA